MSSEMTHNARVEFITAVRHRYAAATHKEKHRILDEFVAATGYHVKSAIRVLNGPGEPKRRRIGKRPSLYDEAARGALIVLWEASDRICGRFCAVHRRAWRAANRLAVLDGARLLASDLGALRPESKPTDCAALPHGRDRGLAR